MDPIEKALLQGNGGQWLDALSSPYATALMWVVPVLFEIGLVWLLVYVWKRRKGASKAKPSLPGTPVSAPRPSQERLVIRAPGGPATKR